MTNEIKTELHPLEPFFPEGARMLMLGSFPPAANRWKMNFYYPNFQNDMWRIFGCVFFDDKDYFLTEDRKSFCEVRIRQFFLKNYGSRSKKGEIPRFELSHNALNRKPQK